jgi:hypothetical protein
MPEEKRALGRHRYKWDNLKMYLREIVVTGTDTHVSE